MIRLHYIVNGEDVFVNLAENTVFDQVMREIQILQSKGMKIIGLETPEVKMFFEPNIGMKSITGKFKTAPRLV